MGKNKNTVIEGIQIVRSILGRISKEDVYGNGFSQDKDTIEQIFEKTSSDKQTDVLARLTVIDSLYSTQMTRRYYGIDELAESLCMLCRQKKRTTKELFKDFAENQDTSLFDFVKIEGSKEVATNLFDEKYGIGKDGSDKGIAISLISKYAYFETGKQFPIYDSIACEIYPLLWSYCGFSKKEQPKLIIRKKGKQEIDASKTMKEFVKAINDFRNKLGDNVSYDHFDRLLWFTGKIRRGNLSLVLTREQYLECIDYSRKNHLFKETNEFCVQKVKDVSNLPFVQQGSLMQDFFELAKQLYCNSSVKS